MSGSGAALLAFALVASPPSQVSPAPGEVEAPPQTIFVPTPADGPRRPPVIFSPREPCRDGCLTPVEAVTYASYLAPKAAVAGEFEFVVAAVGEQGGRFYLNSEQDYRDRNNLTVALSPELAARLADGGGLEAIRSRFLGKRIAVRGIARRVRIDFTTDDELSGKYYFQVHVPVGSASQIAID